MEDIRSSPESQIMTPETPQRKNPPADMLQRIDAYCEEHGISRSVFLSRANVSKALCKSIINGKQLHPRTIERTEKFLAGEAEDFVSIYTPKPRPTVRRDPCPRCQIRGDIGCKHQAANEGRSMYA